ncbi:MAG TPA: adenylosuccinate lyase [Gammaproteobacteria bacterium]|nr:adenylosuccinate lyase [Gammaproteobacteria bacterium]
MDLTALTAISPVDGRYGEKTAELRAVFSEYGLIRHRVLVEVRWLEALSDNTSIEEVPALDQRARDRLDEIVDNFDESDALRVKEIEKTTNHDVKAVEYFLRESFGDIASLQDIAGFLHFACTSEDINNLAYALMLADARTRCMLPAMDEIIETIRDLAHRYASCAMLSHTHGQAASPTTVGKELAVFAHRLKRQRASFESVALCGKLNGATGTYSAHLAAYPDLDWPDISRRFVSALGLEWNPYTTQIEPHDYMAELFHALIRFNTVLLDLCRDSWAYISRGVFKQKVAEGEVGSSTMPHKVNPIDFENAEGNLGLANAILEHLAGKLPVSRLQRDLTDSTALRNLGVGAAHSLIAYQACLRGLSRVDVDEDALAAELDNAWAVLAEPIQTIMRRYGQENPYEQLKALTRGRDIDKKAIEDFVGKLDIPEAERKRLLAMTPASYIGIADSLGEDI